MKVAAYIRVSTVEQATQGLSLVAQEHLLREYAAAHDMTIVELYADEGVSAAKSLEKRTAILRLLRDAEAGRFETIIFKDITRWSRSASQYYAVQDRLDKAGVSWIAVEQPYLETVTPTGRFQVGVMLGVSQLEADQTGQRIKFVQDAEVARGNYPFPPHCASAGYTTVKVDGVNKLVIGEDADLVRQMFAAFLRCGSMSEVGRIFGKPTISVSRILQNRIYIGEFRGIAGFVEPLVSVEDFEQTQRLIRRHSYTPMKHKGEYIFSGLCVCGKCGKTMRGLCPDDKYHMYQCRNGCRNTITQREVERQVLEQVEPELDRYRVTLRQRKKEVADARKLRARIDGKLARVKELYIDGIIDRAEYDRRRSEYESMIVEPPPAPELPNDWRALYQGLKPAQKNVLWKSVLGCVVVVDKTATLSFESAKVLAERMATNFEDAILTR